MSYPHDAGYRNTDTSKAAAEKQTHAKMSANEQRIFAVLELNESTSWEISEATGLNLLQVRPRLTQMKAKRIICSTEHRRTNPHGNKEIVWRITPDYQPQLNFGG